MRSRLRRAVALLPIAALAACGGTAGGPADGRITDGRGTDGAGDPSGADTRALLTRGPWQMIGMEDSGRPYEEGEGGPVLRFAPDGRVYRGCERDGSPYELQGDTIVVHVGSSELRWEIVELTADRFVFSEGPDRFHHEPTRCGP